MQIPWLAGFCHAEQHGIGNGIPGSLERYHIVIRDNTLRASPLLGHIGDDSAIGRNGDLYHLRAAT